MTEAYDDAQVRAALARVWPDGVAASLARVRALGGGLKPRSFLVGVSGRRFVLRMPPRGTAALLDSATEARAMRVAAKAGIAPAVIAVDEQAGLLLTEYFAADPARVPSVRRVAALLRSLHALDVNLPAYAAREIAERYVSAVAVVAPTAPERAWADELLALAREYDARHAPTAFCHNDLFADNVLDDGATLRLVDFEYAVRGAPVLDLAGLAGMNGFGAVARRELLAAYYGGASGAVALDELDAVVRMVRLTSYFWARAAAIDSGAPAAYERLAAQLQATLT
jgi:thiamine kinase-like enzyme